MSNISETVRIWYSKSGSKVGLPWICHIGPSIKEYAKIILQVPSQTKENPGSLPEAWVEATGVVSIEGDVVTIRR